MSRLSTLFATIALSSACAFVPSAPAIAARGKRAHTQAEHAHTACGRTIHHAHARRRRCLNPGAALRRKHAGPPTRHVKRVALAGTRALASPHTRRADGAGTIATVDAGDTASVIADVLATPCEGTELTPQAGDLEQIRAATLCLVNQERARNGELPLQPNAQLEQAAQGHSEAMVGEDYFAHVAPDGETPLQRVQASGYIPNAQVGYTLGENIAWGTLYLATPSSIVAAWIASPDHLANILTSAYRDTAIGVDPAAPSALAEGQPGAVYTQEFGVITR
jgi:uncharacterized protein YkwD